jgi:hypothetical protein
MRLLLSSLLTAWCCACGQWPRELFIDSRFNEAEIAEIKAAVREVNALGRLIDENELVSLSGRFTDENGEFEQRNVDNDRNELYRVDSASECRDFVERYDESFGTIGNLYGFYTGTDIGILVFNLRLPYRPPLRHVVMHELGHFVGMDHVTNNRHAVMHPNAYTTDVFTEADREQFCFQNGCDPD